MTTVTIAHENLQTAELRLSKIARRAAKLGMTPPTMSEVSRETKTLRFTPFRVETIVLVTLEVVGVTPKIGGWTFLGTADFAHSEPTFSMVPGVDVPAAAKLADGSCAHCHTKRNRKSTFILRDERGAIILVGRNCLADFMPTESVANIIAWAHASESFLGDLDEYSRMPYSGGYLDLEHALTVAAMAIRVRGWRSVGAADMDYSVSTRDRVAGYLHPLTGMGADEQRKLLWGDADTTLTDDDRDMADAAIAWARDLSGSDYANKVAIIARDGWCSEKELGVAVSIVGSYTRELAKRAERALQPEPAPVPVDGERIEIAGTVLSTRYDDMFGSLKCLMLEDRGFKIWGTVPGSIASSIERGDKFSCTAKVSKSDKDECFGFFSRPTKAAKIS